MRGSARRELAVDRVRRRRRAALRESHRSTSRISAISPPAAILRVDDSSEDSSDAGAGDSSRRFVGRFVGSSVAGDSSDDSLRRVCAGWPAGRAPILRRASAPGPGGSRCAGRRTRRPDTAPPPHRDRPPPLQRPRQRAEPVARRGRLLEPLLLGQPVHPRLERLAARRSGSVVSARRTVPTKLGVGRPRRRDRGTGTRRRRAARARTAGRRRSRRVGRSASRTAAAAPPSRSPPARGARSFVEWNGPRHDAVGRRACG